MGRVFPTSPFPCSLLNPLKFCSWRDHYEKHRDRIEFQIKIGKKSPPPLPLTELGVCESAQLSPK